MSNAFVPLTAMPGWMEVVARANPLTYAIEAIRTPTQTQRSRRPARSGPDTDPVHPTPGTIRTRRKPESPNPATRHDPARA
ncbi:ABC transporter permease [Nonomuraea sp. M3C6]|uniref:ABC transporter permease n=1 Tax=Nonomuraea marmarensis TaxID=3351344 RepID=A0ABW7AS61_9ACTN